MRKFYHLLLNLFLLGLLFACAALNDSRENNIAAIYDTLDCEGVTETCSNGLGHIINCSAYNCISNSTEVLNCTNVASNFFTWGKCENTGGPIRHCDDSNVRCYADGGANPIEPGWFESCTGYDTKERCFELKGCYWDGGCYSTNGELSCIEAATVTERTCPSNPDSCYRAESDLQDTCENISTNGHDCVWHVDVAECRDRG